MEDDQYLGNDKSFINDSIQSKFFIMLFSGSFSLNVSYAYIYNTVSDKVKVWKIQKYRISQTITWFCISQSCFGAMGSESLNDLLTFLTVIFICTHWPLHSIESTVICPDWAIVPVHLLKSSVVFVTAWSSSVAKKTTNFAAGRNITGNACQS